MLSHLKRTPIYPLLQSIRHTQWIYQGRPVPPPNVVKQRAVREYASRFGLHILVETGTFQGDMIAACRSSFDRIISIELSETLHARAKQRFSRYPHIELLLGDSTEQIQHVLNRLSEAALFWLDAHAMGSLYHTARGQLETPIVQELQQIFQHRIRDHVILIDDARFFVGENDYPTLDELRSLVASQRDDLLFEVRDDIIRLTPRR
jgi:hypothetical protein